MRANTDELIYHFDSGIEIVQGEASGEKQVFVGMLLDILQCIGELQ